jgi:cytochrome b561
MVPGAQAGLFLYRVSLIIPFTGMLGNAWSMRMRPTFIFPQFVVRVES